MKFSEILDKINPCLPGYRVLYVENGKQVDKFFVDYRGLHMYCDFYVQGITSYEQEGYGACLSFSLSKAYF